MERISSSLLASIRNALSLRHIAIVDEYATEVAYIFVLDNPQLMYWEMDELRRIAPINVCTPYHEGNKHLAITILLDR